MRSQYEKEVLFPALEPHTTMRVDTGDGHRLYVEECGNPDGIPVIFLHGGPGAGTTPTHRRFFDPGLFRIILFDQRGAGRSQPFAEIGDNTTWHLVDDMERIRTRCGIDRWIIFGGSWGSTLGLAYGMTHPAHCLGFVLRGIFLGTAAEVDWFINGMGRFYPEAWQRFSSFIPEPERHDLLTAYARRLITQSPAVAIPAADAWSCYENSCSTLKAEMRGSGGRMALSLARIEAHYFVNNCFLDGRPILRHIGAFAHLPGVIVQGRHDVICPPGSATQLAAAWGDACELVMVDEAGHSAFEPGVAKALVDAVSRMAQRVAHSL